MAAPAAAIAKERAIVLPVEVASDVAAAVSVEERRRLEDEIGLILQRYRRLQALTAREVRQFATLEANRQSSGCDDAGCASEIASALGARFVFSARIERKERRLMLSLTLIDGAEAKVLARATAQGERLQDLRVQLPFAVDDVVTSLRLPGDPTPGQMLAEARPKLAVLPVRGADAKQQVAIARAVDAAAARAAERLGLVMLDGAAYREIVVGRGCAAEDHICGLPAVAARGATLGLGVSLNTDGPTTTVRASLLRPDGSVVARAESLVAGGRDGQAIAAAVGRTVDAAAAARLTGTPVAATAATAMTASATEAAPKAGSEGPSDDVMLDFPCNIQRGIEAVGSRCFLSQRTLRIEPHVLNIQSHREILLFSDVDSAIGYAPLGLLPSGIRLRFKDGSVRDLIVGVGERERLLARFREQLAH